MPQVGKYLIVDDNCLSQKVAGKLYQEETYKVLAIIKYVEETKLPRIGFHVDSSLKDDTAVLEITSARNGYLEDVFSMNL